MIPVIHCGGVGTKMWPLSRKGMPKHFLPLLPGGESLFVHNWKVLRQKFQPEQSYLQTNPKQAKIASAQVSEIMPENIFLEPVTKNTGPASGLAAARLFKIAPDEPFMLIQADVLRQTDDQFFNMLTVCERLAKETGRYITGGYQPKFAVMGVDYLIPGKQVSLFDEAETYEVESFLWRADKEVVKTYLEKQGAFLHANHTCMTPRGFLAMYQRYRPDWYEPLKNITEGKSIEAEYKKMQTGPIEEVTEHVYKNHEALVVKLPFAWTDFGTWESYANFQNQYGYQSTSRVIELGSGGNFAKTASSKTTVFIGVEDVIVVDTDDALLVCKKEHSAKVGEVVKLLEAEKDNDLL